MTKNIYNGAYARTLENRSLPTRTLAGRTLGRTLIGRSLGGTLVGEHLEGKILGRSLESSDYMALNEEDKKSDYIGDY